MGREDRLDLGERNTLYVIETVWYGPGFTDRSFFGAWYTKEEAVKALEIRKQRLSEQEMHNFEHEIVIVNLRP